MHGTFKARAVWLLFAMPFGWPWEWFHRLMGIEDSVWSILN